MNWNPNQAQPTQAFPFQPQPAVVQQQPQGFGPPQGVPQYGAPPGPGPAPAPFFGQPQAGAPGPAPAQGFGQPGGLAPQGVPMGQPQGFGVPQAPQGFAQPQPFNQPVAFNAQDPSLDDKEEGPPVGMTSFECTGEVELGGRTRNLLVVKLRTLQSQTAQPGTLFAFKRDLTPHRQWGVKYASDEIGKFIVAIMGLDKTTPASQITPLINELVQTGKLGGQSIAGRRGVVTGVQKQLPPKPGEAQGKVVTNGTWQKHP